MHCCVLGSNSHFHFHFLKLCNCVLNALIFPHQSHLDVFQRHSINSWNVSDKYRTKIAGNPTWKMHYSELTNWRRANWQTGGGAKSALVPSRNQLHKFWQAYPGATLPLIPTMYDTWGGTSRILGVRGLRKKLSPLEGFRHPTNFQVSWRIWLGHLLLEQAALTELHFLSQIYMDFSQFWFRFSMNSFML